MGTGERLNGRWNRFVMNLCDQCRDVDIRVASAQHYAVAFPQCDENVFYVPGCFFADLVQWV